MRACHKVMLEKVFLPAIAEIVQACRSLMGSVDDAKRERTWAEAWKEILGQVRKCGIYDKPVWSTPEIAAAVKAYGYTDLCGLNRDELQTASAQCRRFYEDACGKKNEQSVNDFVLKRITGAEMIGLMPGQTNIISLEGRRKALCPRPAGRRYVVPRDRFHPPRRESVHTEPSFGQEGGRRWSC